jgi:hypothetical protein
MLLAFLDSTSVKQDARISTGLHSENSETTLVDVRFCPHCGLKPDTAVRPKRAMKGLMHSAKKAAHWAASKARFRTPLSRVLTADRYCELKNGAIRVRFDEPQFAPVVCD